MSRRPLLIVDLVADSMPDYCVSGETFCASCERACWLGQATYEVVAKEGAVPICVPCATKLREQGVLPASPSRHVDDPKR